MLKIIKPQPGMEQDKICLVRNVMLLAFSSCEQINRQCMLQQSKCDNNAAVEIEVPQLDIKIECVFMSEQWAI